MNFPIFKAKLISYYSSIYDYEKAKSLSKEYASIIREGKLYIPFKSQYSSLDDLAATVTLLILVQS
jgi:hypothetical protein